MDPKILRAFLGYLCTTFFGQEANQIGYLEGVRISVDDASSTDDKADDEETQDAGGKQDRLLLTSLVVVTCTCQKLGQECGYRTILQIDFDSVEDFGCRTVFLTHLSLKLFAFS